MENIERDKCVKNTLDSKYGFMVIWEHMQIQTVKTTVEINADLLFLAKMRALQEGKSLKDIINISLAKNLKASKEKTVDLLSKIQEIVKDSAVAKEELQKSGREIRKRLVNKYYQEK